MMHKKKNQWLGKLVDELKMQAQKSFQIGTFEKYPVQKPMKKLLN